LVRKNYQALDMTVIEELEEENSWENFSKCISNYLMELSQAIGKSFLEEVSDYFIMREKKEREGREWKEKIRKEKKTLCLLAI